MKEKEKMLSSREELNALLTSVERLIDSVQYHNNLDYNLFYAFLLAAENSLLNARVHIDDVCYE